MKRRSNLPHKPDDVEQVAANGLLHRRALLGRSVAIAGLAGAGLGAAATGAAAEQLVEQPWGLQMGEDTPAYQTPSKFAKNVVRTLANPKFEPRSSLSRTPHHLLEGTRTPNTGC
jgi:sulfane dehydrogenase subunit SoxC